MKRFWIVCLWILSSVALFSRVTEVSMLPFQNPVVAVSCAEPGASVQEISSTSNLEEIVKHTCYKTQPNQVVSGNERSNTGSQRRNVQLNREVKDYPVCNYNDSFISYHKLSGGDYLNVSAPKQFFIYTLHRIRI